MARTVSRLASAAILYRKAVERALLRRQARQVQRLEEQDAWRGEEPLWLVAPHVPHWMTSADG